MRTEVGARSVESARMTLAHVGVVWAVALLAAVVFWRRKR